MIGTTLAFLVGSSAHAQALAWQLEPGAVLAPDPALSYMSRSVSNPAVAWDSVHGQFVMLFETRTSTVSAACPAGVWAIGMATSPDGFVWTPEPSAVVMPVPGSGTYWQCVAAHPTVLFDPASNGGNGTLHVWFKAQQGTSCPNPAPAWGCSDATGIGKASIRLDAAGDPSSTTVRSTPVWNAAGRSFGYPKVVRDDGYFRMLVQVYPDIWGGRTTSANNTISLSPSMRLTDAQLAMPWAVDELMNPSLVCEDSTAYSRAAFVGGRDTAFGEVVHGAWSKSLWDAATSSWLYATEPEVEWTNDTEWRHWDVHKLASGPDEYVVWFDEKDAAGNNFIRVGGTTLTFTGADLVSKVCP